VSASNAPGLTRALAERVAALAFEDLPGDVVEIARQCLLDWLGVTLGGSREPGPRVLLAVLPSGDPADERTVSVVGHERRLTALHAALVNGTASHALDFDDVNMSFVGHASVATLGAALALGEQLDADARTLLSAFVAGYETTCRIALAIGPEPYLHGHHSTGTVGTFGASAACARLLGLDAQATAVAFGIAASQAAGSKANFGTMTKPLHAGKACENGLLAAQLAAGGFTASPEAIEADRGFAALAGGGCDADAALADPPAGWHLRENLFKHHATCYFTHSTIEGIRALRDRDGIAADQVRSVTAHVGAVELGTCAIPEPATGLEVKFSLAHIAAMALLGRSTAVITDADAGDAEVIAMRSRVALRGDGEPGSPTRVEVELADGRTLAAAEDVSTPQRDLAAQRSRLLEKFSVLSVPVLGAERARALAQVVTGLSPQQPIRELISLTRP
jgi:2-methylcitrate dehydratase PrpD